MEYYSLPTTGSCIDKLEDIMLSGRSVTEGPTLRSHLYGASKSVKHTEGVNRMVVERRERKLIGRKFQLPKMNTCSMGSVVSMVVQHHFKGVALVYSFYYIGAVTCIQRVALCTTMHPYVEVRGQLAGSVLLVEAVLSRLHCCAVLQPAVPRASGQFCLHLPLRGLRL